MKAARNLMQSLSPRKESTLVLRDNNDSKAEPSAHKSQSNESVQSFTTVSSKTSRSTVSQASQGEPSPCGRCRRLVVDGDEALECEICQQWFHNKCENVPKALYKMILESNSNKGKTKKSRPHWYCGTCECNSVDFFQALRFQQTKITALESRIEQNEKLLKQKADEEVVDKLEDRIKVLEEKQDETYISDNWEERVKAIEDKQEEQQIAHTAYREEAKIESDSASVVIKEMQEREERKPNMIFYGVPESDSASIDARKSHDTKQLQEICKLCDEKVKQEEIVNIRRLGKPGGPNKPRPMHVKFTTDAKKGKIFKNMYRVKNSKTGLSTVTVANDLTVKQREEEKRLKEEAKKLEEESSGEFKARVRGPPWARKIVKIRQENKN